jgi:glycosyltransferase involved in cell wall biosynthesis
MAEKMPHILFHRPTPWESELQCSTKTYAKAFSEKGYRVSYLQSPINLGHRLLKKGYYSTYSKGSRMENNIWVSTPLTFIPHLDNKGSALAKFTGSNSYRTATPSIKNLIEASGYGAPDIIWTTIPGSSVLKEFFPKARLFFHVVDKYSAYRGKGVQELEKRDYKNADHLFVIGEALSKYLQNDFEVEPKKITNLGQGVHLAQYRQILTEPSSLINIPKPRAVWVGLTKKLDRAMLSTAHKIMAAKGGSLVLVGPTCAWLPEFIEQHPNAHFVGPVQSPEVPAYLKASQIGLMLYDRTRQEIYQGQHPLKLYEYAAAGLPVLCTPHEEFETLKPPILEVQREDEVAQALSSALENYQQHNVAMLAFAEKHSWQSCLQRAEEAFRQFNLI